MDVKKLSLEELNRLDVEAYKQLKKTPITVVLDDIRSALNVGSFFRTSDAFAIQKIYLCGITAKPPHKEILKTAIGATESVEWEYNDDVGVTLQELSKTHTCISIEQTTDSLFLDQVQNGVLECKEHICLIFGNEVKGVSEAALSMSDYFIEIPQFGTKHSLNVSVCGGIVLWEFWKLLNQES